MRIVLKQNGDYTDILLNGTNKVASVKYDEQAVPALRRVLETLSLMTDDVEVENKGVCKECDDSGLVEDCTDSAGYGCSPSFYTCKCRTEKNPQVS